MKESCSVQGGVLRNLHMLLAYKDEASRKSAELMGMSITAKQ